MAHTPMRTQAPATAFERNLCWHEGNLAREERWVRLGQRGTTIWFTGLSGSGKSTVAAAVE